MRKWNNKRSKNKRADQHQEYRKTLKIYFDGIKADKDNDYILIEDLEDPFITLGLATSRKEVREIVEKYDDNGNGKIEFEEFLEILDGRLHTKGDSLFSKKRTTFQEFFRSKISLIFQYIILIDNDRFESWEIEGLRDYQRYAFFSCN